MWRSTKAEVGLRRNTGKKHEAGMNHVGYDNTIAEQISVSA